MTFFDKKSEVINIELTPYGKYLLGRGKFKPAYYEFIDSDVLYDSSYVGISEDRNNISTRIKSETPSLRPQYVFSGVETKLKELTKRKSQLQSQRKTAVKDEELIENAQTYEKLYYNTAPLGNSNLDDTYPALNLNVYNIEISSSQTYKLTNSHPMIVPQITLKNINYSSSILLADENDPRLDLITENQFSLQNNLSPENSIRREEPLQKKIFSDNSYIEIEDKSILLQFFEDNVKNIGDNFEIEVYTYETGSRGEEVIKQLYFNKTDELFVDDSNKVEYYFEIIKDNNVSQMDLKSVKERKQPQVFKINK